jgi:hypothetical protein
MPGTVVRDALETDLLDGVTLTTAAGANQAGTAKEILWPGDVTFALTSAGKSGTTPSITVDIQGCEVSTFNDNKVKTLATLTGADLTDGTVLSVTTYVDSKYIRAVSTVAGTSGVYTGSTLVTVPKHDRRVRASGPTAKKLA